MSIVPTGTWTESLYPNWVSEHKNYCSRITDGAMTQLGLRLSRITDGAMTQWVYVSAALPMAR